MAGTRSRGLSRRTPARGRSQYLNGIWHEKLVSDNLRIALVENIALLYADRGVDLVDLVKEGSLGLAHALENFELEGGARFSSYAARCIRQNMERAIMSRCGTGHLATSSGMVPAAMIAGSFVRRAISARGEKNHHPRV